uniref:Apple domain-containing protein n=1 Tax=viral metagenome TaxID=1070528 RepID=A0A6C0D845_9ZZZZ
MGNITSIIDHWKEDDAQRQLMVDSYVKDLNKLSYQPDKDAGGNKIYVDKFNILLNEYKDKYATYLKLQKADASRNIAQYISTQGVRFNGNGGVLSTNTAKDIPSCQALCSADLKCSGFNYNSSTQACELQGGLGGSISLGSKDEHGGINKAMDALFALYEINTKLIALNDEINKVNKNAYPEFKLGLGRIFLNDENLFNQNQSLRMEREKIRQALNAYNDADTEYVNRAMDVEQHYAYYNIWFIVMVVLVCLLISMVLFPGYNGNVVSKSIWTIIIIVIIVATLNLNNPIAFAIWLLLICTVLAMKSNLIPSI